MKKLLSTLFLLLLAACLFAQNVVVTFTGRDLSNNFIPLSKVVITDVTQNWQETIFYPDTIYNMSIVGIDERDENLLFSLSNNMPNPFEGTSFFKLQLPANGRVHIEISDLNGRQIAAYESVLPAGSHLFQAQLSTPQSYVLTARSGKHSASMKMMNTGSSANNQLKYLGESKNNEITVDLGNSIKDETHPFHVGDQMVYVGYAEVNGIEHQSQTIQQQQVVSEDFIFQFQGVVPSEFTCGMSTVTDHEGNVYNTVLIGDQCWMKENMRCTTSPSTGTTILDYPTNSYSYTGKKAYYVNSNANNTTQYGLLYNWCAAVDTFNVQFGETSTNTTSSNAPSITFTGTRRGICPQGWHIPSDAEWTLLTNYVRSQSEYVCGSISGSISDNIAKALASRTGWISSTSTCAVGNSSANNNATGFTAVPAGNYDNYNYNGFGNFAYFWSASQNSSYSNYAHSRYLFSDFAHVVSLYDYKSYGCSVRCLRDEGSEIPDPPITPDGGQPCPGTPTVTDIDGNTYNTVQVGDQCWMKENLRTTKYSDGTTIALGSTTSTSTAYRYNPNDDANNVTSYGYLYNWKALMRSSSSSSSNPSGVQGICPTGWHVPSDAEWTQLTDYVSSQSEYVCGDHSNYIAKALASATGWYSYSDACAVGNTPASNNATGFSAVPAGHYGNYGYGSFSSGAKFWSATQSDSDFAYYRDLSYYNAYVSSLYSSKSYGLSVRCVKD